MAVTHLYCNRNGSDKEYIVHMVPEPTGNSVSWNVYSYYGKRGNASHCTTHLMGVREDVALIKYRQVIKTKKAKGYIDMEVSGIPVVKCLPKLINHTGEPVYETKPRRLITV